MKRFIDAVADLSRLLAKWLSNIGGVIIVVSMVTVLMEILTRFLFGATGGALDLTFRGSYEIVRYSLMLGILYALPNALKDGQVIVELFTEKWPMRWKQWVGGCYVICFGLFGWLLTTGLFESIEQAARTGQTTQDLGIPMAPIYWAAMLGTVMLGIRGFTVAWEYFTDQRNEAASS